MCKCWRLKTFLWITKMVSESSLMLSVLRERLLSDVNSKICDNWDFPGSPVGKTSSSNTEGVNLILVKGLRSHMLFLFCRPVMYDSLWPAGLQHASSPWPPSPVVAQVHVHCISDVIQPSHPLTLSSPSAFNFSQHQGIFQWVSCSHQMTRILEFQLQHQLFQWVFRIDFPSDWCLCCPRDSQESSPAPQFEGINSLAICPLYGPALTSIRDHWEDHLM